MLLRSTYVVLLFVILEAAAVSIYARSSVYTEARIISGTTYLWGRAGKWWTGVRHYGSLGRQNRALLEQVARLEERVQYYEEVGAKQRQTDSLVDLENTKYRVMTASVVKNSVGMAHNYIILDRGRDREAEIGMAVLSPEGAMVGYVIDCTPRYSVAVSILNRSFKASGRLVGSEYFGSIRWDGGSPEYVTLDEISKYADPKPGQQVVSTGFSQYFPAGVAIGVVESAKMNETGTSYAVRVRLTASLSSLTEALLVENRDLREIESLEQGEKIEQYNRPE